jgi:hypothetical protein
MPRKSTFMKIAGRSSDLQHGEFGKKMNEGIEETRRRLLYEEPTEYRGFYEMEMFSKWLAEDVLGVYEYDHLYEKKAVSMNDVFWGALEKIKNDPPSVKDMARPFKKFYANYFSSFKVLFDGVRQRWNYMANAEETVKFLSTITNPQAYWNVLQPIKQLARHPSFVALFSKEGKNNVDYHIRELQTFQKMYMFLENERTDHLISRRSGSDDDDDDDDVLMRTFSHSPILHSLVRKMVGGEDPDLPPTRVYFVDYDTGELQIISPWDWFDFTFWNPRKSFFHGFKPIDGIESKLRMMNPTGWGAVIESFVFPPIMLFQVVPADALNFTIWWFHWLNRMDTVRDFLNGTETWRFHGNHSIQDCLPGFPYLPDPRYGCRFPTFAEVPPVISNEGFVRLFTTFPQVGNVTIPIPEPCWEWELNPLRMIEGAIQVILTPLLHPLLETSSLVRFVVDSTPLITIIDSSGKVDEIQNYCMVPPLFFNIILLIFGVIFMIRCLFETYVGFSSLGGGGGFSSLIQGPDGDVDTADVKGELHHASTLNRISMKYIVYSITSRINSLKGKIKPNNFS